jgi:hypothetical protein
MTQGGWQQEPIRMEAAEEAPVTFVDPFHAEWEEEGRVRHSLYKDLPSSYTFKGPAFLIVAFQCHVFPFSSFYLACDHA